MKRLPFVMFGLLLVLSASLVAQHVRVNGVTLATTILNAVVSGIGTTSTDGLTSQNTTAATSGATQQFSPRIKLCGTAWNSVGMASETNCWLIEAQPQTAAGATNVNLVMSSSIAGGAFGNAVTYSSGGSFRAAAAGVIGNTGRALMASSASGLWNVTDSTLAFGVQLNTGTAAPTAANCGTPTITTGSRNTAGEVTAGAVTSCDIVFGAPAFTNTPFCAVTDETSIVALRISAIATTGFTVNNIVSGDKFMWICLGRI